MGASGICRWRLKPAAQQCELVGYAVLTLSLSYLQSFVKSVLLQLGKEALQNCFDPVSAIPWRLPRRRNKSLGCFYGGAASGPGDRAFPDFKLLFKLGQPACSHRAHTAISCNFPVSDICHPVTTNVLASLPSMGPMVTLNKSSRMRETSHVPIICRSP